MTLPFTLPDWLPAWAFLLLALPALLYLFVFLLMPFSVFGVKARLETLENQLDAIQEELRGLSRPVSGLAPRPLADEDYDVPNFGLLKSGAARNLPDPAPPRMPAPLRPIAAERVPPVAPVAHGTAARLK